MASLNRRDFLTAVGAGAAAGTVSALGTAAAAQPAGAARLKRPNILFLFSDDQRHDTIHALGNDVIRTPHLDTLVRRGTAFTHAHIMGSTQGAVCVCSRAMLLTGRSLWRSPGNCPPELPLWPEVMQRAGYATFGTGKWHNGAPSYARCFTHGANIFFGGMCNHSSVPVHAFDPEGKYPKEGRHVAARFSSELFSDAAVQFLREYKDDKPFLMYVSYTAPHDPRMAPREFADVYPPDRIPLPENFLPRHPFDNGEMSVRDEKLAPWPRTPEIVRAQIADYYAMITHMDDQIGRVLAALEETGHADNTIVLFAGDNGLAVGQHGLFGKQNLYEHSIRVPLVIAGPGIPEGQRRDALVYLHDLLPTLCEMLGISTPDTVEGKSLAPVIQGGQEEVRDSIFAAYRDVQRMVRDRQYKLIQYTVKGERRVQLFDLAADPWEKTDLSADPDHAKPLAALEARLKQWQKETGDALSA